MFGRATIRLGIGPHSSVDFIMVLLIFALLPINLTQQYLLNVSALTAEIGWRVLGTPANFNGFCFASWLYYYTDITQQRSTELCMMFGRLLGALVPNGILPAVKFTLVHYIYTFWGLLSPNGILPGVKFTLHQILHSPILEALLHGTQAVGVN